jgi:F-type H+-transporting ATPase subunit b
MKRIALAALFALLSAFVLCAQHEAPAEGGHAAATAEKAGGAHHEEGEGNLEIWKWANFAILAGGLGYLIGKNAPAFFRARTEEIRKGIAEATQVKKDAEARAAAMEVRMASLGVEIERLRGEAKTAMAKEMARIGQETAQHMARLEARGQQEIEALTSHAQKDLKAYAAALAVELAGERIRARMSGERQDALFGGFLKQLDGQATLPEVRR